MRRTWNSFRHSFWQFYERFYAWLFRLRRVGPADGLLRIGFSRYYGPGLDLPGGVQVQPGERVGDLHLENDAVIALRETTVDRLVFFGELFGRMRQSMEYLAQEAKRAPDLQLIRAFRGTSVLAAIARRLGFEVFPMESNWARRLETRTQLFFFRHYVPEEYERRKQKGLESHRMWISRTRLLELYDPATIVSLPLGEAGDKTAL
jgi:hypothetical protein